MTQKRKEREELGARGRGDNVRKGESWSLLIDWTFTVTELGDTSVQLVRGMHAHASPLPAVFVCLKMNGDGMPVSVTCT